MNPVPVAAERSIKTAAAADFDDLRNEMEL